MMTCLVDTTHAYTASSETSSFMSYNTLSISNTRLFRRYRTARIAIGVGGAARYSLVWLSVVTVCEQRYDLDSPTLLSFCIDKSCRVLNNRHLQPLITPGYFPMLVFGYAIGLMMANFAVEYFETGQPALLYIVPLTLGPALLRSFKTGCRP